MDLPTGTVTFLFTDIESSTRLLQQLGDGYARVLAEHDALLASVIGRYGGFVVRTQGDGAFAAFQRAVDAVAAAAAIQQALSSHSWPEGVSIMVRMGLHTGEPEISGADYVGLDVHRAARIGAAGHGGQVLLSETTYSLVQGELPPGVTIIDLGLHRLKDLRTPKHLYQLVLPGLPAGFPPLKSLDGAANNLPAQITSFVGRENELAEIKQILNLSGLPDLTGSRVLTLIGPGGTGKTRLSLQAAAEVLDHYPDGVWLVELAPLADPRLIVPAVASTLNMPAVTDRPLETALVDFLRRRHLLLILDNCEHLIEECARLADSLQRACPQLRILASSREALGIGGERVFRVRSLPLPPDQQQVLASDVCDFAAVQLFRDRALAVKPDFTLAADNCAAIAQICRRLDGIPLAIELAAARARVLTPQQIAERLDDRFRLLTGGSRTALPRQRTLHALIDWSYDLLSHPECILLRRLSVFSGGWTLEAAEAVCSGDGIESFEVLDLLDQLVSKSLVVADEQNPGMRYRLLETIRQYAQEKLLESGEATALRERHLAYFVGLNLQAGAASLALRNVQEWVDKLKPEVDNVSAAQAWALDHDLHSVLQLAGAVGMRWRVGAQVLETQRFLQMALARAELDPDFGPAGSPGSRSLLATAYFNLCAATFSRGQGHEALRLALRSVAIAREADDAEVEAAALGMVATAARLVGELDMARQYAAESRSLAEQVGARLSLAMVLMSSLGIPPSAGAADPAQVWDDWRKGMAMFREGTDYWGLGIGYQLAAIVARLQGDLAKAQFYAEASLTAFEMLSGPNSHFTRIPSSILAELAWRRGELDGAEREFKEMLPFWLDSGNSGAVARVLEILAFISRERAEKAQAGSPATQQAAHEQLARAATLLGAAGAIRSAYQTPMAPHEDTEYDAEVAALRRQMEPQALAAAWAAGGRMGLEEAVEWADG